MLSVVTVLIVIPCCVPKHQLSTSIFLQHSGSHDWDISKTVHTFLGFTPHYLSHRMVSWAGSSQNLIYNQNNTQHGSAIDGQHATAMEAYCDSSIISPLCLVQIQLHNTRSFLLNGYLNYKPEINKGTGGEQQMEMEALSHLHCYLQC